MLDTSLRIALSPVLLMQAATVRARALQLPEASGPREGTIGSGPALSVLILGDSSAAGVGVAHQDQALAGQLSKELSQNYTLNWRLIAKTGATTASTLKHLEGQAPSRFDIVVTALGVNDVTHAVPFKVWQQRQQALRARINQLFAPRLVYMTGVPPLGLFPILPQPLRWTLGRQVARFNAALATTLAAEKHWHHIGFDLPLDPTQMAADRFHPGPEIYAIWAKEMASRINTDWPLVANQT